MDNQYLALLAEYAWMVIIVAVGALVNVLKHAYEAQSSEDTTFTLLYGAYITAGALFSGAVFGLIATHFLDAPAVIGALAGLGGYLGVRGLEQAFDLVVDFVKSWTKSKSPDDERDSNRRNNNRRYNNNNRSYPRVEEKPPEDFMDDMYDE